MPLFNFEVDQTGGEYDSVISSVTQNLRHWQTVDAILYLFRKGIPNFTEVTYANLLENGDIEMSIRVRDPNAYDSHFFGVLLTSHIDEHGNHMGEMRISHGSIYNDNQAEQKTYLPQATSIPDVRKDMMEMISSLVNITASPQSEE